MGQQPSRAAPPRAGAPTFTNVCRATNVFFKLMPAGVAWAAGARNPARLRAAVIEAGPVVVKAAQWAVDRDGLLPPAVAEALRPLQLYNLSHPWAHTEALLAGLPADAQPTAMDAVPFACGSVGQVYHGRAGDAPVVVKVLHPRIVHGIDNDLDALIFVLRAFPEVALLDMSEVRASVLAQTDLRLEARNLARLAGNFAGHPAFFFPRPLAATRHVLVETHVPGVPLRAFAAQHPARAYEAALLRIAAYIKMAWVDNFMHGDMHSGNLLFSLEGDQGEGAHVRMAMVDVGMISSVRSAEALHRFSRSLFSMRVADIATLLEELNISGRADLAGFRAAMEALEAAVPLDARRCIDGSDSSGILCVIRGTLAALRAHRLQIPGDMVVMVGTLIVLHGSTEAYLPTPAHDPFRDAMLYAHASGLIDVRAWLGPEVHGRLLAGAARASPARPARRRTLAPPGHQEMNNTA